MIPIDLDLPPTAKVGGESQATRLQLSIENESRNATRRIKVAVVDDDPNDLLLLKRVLDGSEEFRCEVCYTCAQEALDMLPSTQVDVVLMDVRMPRMSGISCLQHLKRALPMLTIILVTGLPEIDVLREALLAGADGFLDKAVSSLEYCEAIHYALAGGLPLAKTLGAIIAGTKPSILLPLLLSERETAVMECIALGLPNKEIADKIGLSIGMVKYEARRIYAKLGAANRPEAVSCWRSRIG